MFKYTQDFLPDCNINSASGGRYTPNTKPTILVGMDTAGGLASTNKDYWKTSNGGHYNVLVAADAESKATVTKRRHFDSEQLITSSLYPTWMIWHC